MVESTDSLPFPESGVMGGDLDNEFPSGIIVLAFAFAGVAGSMMTLCVAVEALSMLGEDAAEAPSLTCDGRSASPSLLENDL
jgi:hypothetical protein